LFSSFEIKSLQSFGKAPQGWRSPMTQIKWQRANAAASSGRMISIALR
jgi:hypothetical protein